MKKKKINIKFNLRLKLFLLTSFIIVSILIGLIINSFKEDEIIVHEYKSDYISFAYDNTFKIEKEKDYIKLITKDKKAMVAIKKLDYTTNSKDKNQSEIAASISYQVLENKNGYIETYNNYVNENNINRYYYLYENYKEERQLEVITTFEEDYIYVVIYSAKNNEFDLYSESISIIVNSLEV